MVSCQFAIIDLGRVKRDLLSDRFDRVERAFDQLVTCRSIACYSPAQESLVTGSCPVEVNFSVADRSLSAHLLLDSFDVFCNRSF